MGSAHCRPNTLLLNQHKDAWQRCFVLFLGSVLSVLNHSRALDIHDSVAANLYFNFSVLGMAYVLVVDRMKVAMWTWNVLFDLIDFPIARSELTTVWTVRSDTIAHPCMQKPNVVLHPQYKRNHVHFFVCLGICPDLQQGLQSSSNQF